MGFSKAFGLGVAEGIFDSTSRNMSAFLQADREEAKEIAKDESDIIRADSARYNTEYQGYKKEMKDLLGKVDNDPDALQFIFSKYGYDTGKKHINDVHGRGLSVTDFFKLKERMKGTPSINVDQLATWQTTPVTTRKTTPDYSKLGGGFTRLFGGQDAMKNIIEGKIESRTSGLPGVGVSLDDIPETRLEDDKLEDWEIGTLPDPSLESIRLTRRMNNAIEKGDMQLASRIKFKRDSNLILDDIERNVQAGKSLTDNQVQKMRNIVMREFDGAHNGVFGADFNPTTGDLFFATKIPELFEHGSERADILVSQMVELMKMGFSQADVTQQIRIAINQNKMIDFDNIKDQKIITKETRLEDVIKFTNKSIVDTELFIQDPTDIIDFTYYPSVFTKDNNGKILLENTKETLRQMLGGVKNPTDALKNQTLEELKNIGVPEKIAEQLVLRITGTI